VRRKLILPTQEGKTASKVGEGKGVDGFWVERKSSRRGNDNYRGILTFRYGSSKSNLDEKHGPKV